MCCLMVQCLPSHRDTRTKTKKKDREKLLNLPRRRNEMKIAWVSTYNPRVPSKTAIVKKNLHLLHANVEILPPPPLFSLSAEMMVGGGGGGHKNHHLGWQTEKEKISHKCTSLLFHRDTSSMGPRTDHFSSLQRKVRHVSPFKKPHCSCISVGR